MVDQSSCRPRGSNHPSTVRQAFIVCGDNLSLGLSQSVWEADNDENDDDLDETGLVFGIGKVRRPKASVAMLRSKSSIASKRVARDRKKFILCLSSLVWSSCDQPSQ